MKMVGQDGVMHNFNNCLILYEVELDYLDFHFSEINKYITNTTKLNYTEFFKDFGVFQLQRQIDQIISDNEIEIVFIFQFENNYEFSPGFYNSLRDRCRIVFWLFDDELLLHAHSKFYAQTADAVISTDYFGRNYYESIGIPTVLYFSSYSKDDYYPKKIEKEYDVSFVGVVSEIKNNRMELIRFLKESGVNISVFGPGSDNGFVTFEEMVDVFNKSRINLNFSGISILPWIYNHDPLLIARSKQNKGRPIEIALTDSFCLSEYAPSLPYMFTVGEEIDMFRNREELLSKIRYYLDNGQERERIAANAYKRALKEYESDVYIKHVFEELSIKLEVNEQYRTPKLEVYVNDLFRKRRLFFFVRSMRRRLKKFKVKQTLELFWHLQDERYSLAEIVHAFVLDMLKIRTI